MKTIDYILNYLKENLTEKRYSHSLGSAESAKKLAIKYNLDPDKAYLAGLVHDCAKNFDNEELLNIIKNEIKEGFLESELKNYKVYHSIVAPYIAKREFEIDDKEILSAIRKHTIGSVDMTLFDKIIFLADKIEENTRSEEYAFDMREIIKKDNSIETLDRAIFICFEKTIKSLVDRKLYICPITIDVYNALLEKLN